MAFIPLPMLIVGSVLAIFLLGGGVPPIAAQPVARATVQPSAPTTSPSAPEAAARTSAVPHGTLVIVGGRPTDEIRRRFVDLAGGDDADVVCVPTAFPVNDWAGLPLTRWVGWCEWFFRRADVPEANRTILHTRDSVWADTEAFVEPLRTADAVWFTGGRQWRLLTAYAGTKAENAFRDVLERGGVIGGSSAGASIQGSFLVRGDPESKDIVVGEYTRGFGYLPNTAIDQHLLARDREYDLIEVVEERPHLLGLGIAEQTAAIVRGNTLRVMGERKIAVYDARRWQRADRSLSKDEQFFFLHPADRFNLARRTVLPPAR